MRTKTAGYFFDVVIVGGGMAGCEAAIAAKESQPEARVAMVVAGEQGQGGCSKKTHGINAAVNANDTWGKHFEDTMKGGGGINNPQLVSALCQQIPERLRELEQWGMEFDHLDGQYDVGNYGGSSQGRSIHWRDLTGRRIMQVLINTVTFNNCAVFEHRWIVGLVVEDGQCHGVIAVNKMTDEIETYRAKAVVLASGGGACIFPIATISADKLASGIMMAYAQGARLVDMEMVQFHPTGLVLPGSPGHGEILEEEVRMQNAALRNRHGQRFMQNYDSRGEKATRDIVARASYLEILQGRGTDNNAVILDISELDKGWLLRRFPYMVERARSWGVDFATQNQVEVSPAAHYLMGGIVINLDCATDIVGLYACGEDAGGIDGGNRLGGNGVAGTLVFGKIAGRSAVTYAGGRTAFETPDSVEHFNFYLVSKNEHLDVDSALKNAMWHHAGLVRSHESLTAMSKLLEDFRERLNRDSLSVLTDGDQVGHDTLIRGKTLMYKLQLAQLITASALARKNSVGAHYRSDAEPNNQPFNIFVQRTRDGDTLVQQTYISPLVTALGTEA